MVNFIKLISNKGVHKTKHISRKVHY